MAGFQLPLSPRDVAEIGRIRTELSNQLISASDRRNELADALRTADAAARPGIQERLAVLDARIVRLEQDIAETGRLLTSAPRTTTVTTATTVATPFGGLSSDQVTGISIVFTIFVLAPMAFAAARLMFRRGSRPPAPRESPEAQQRLQRVEQALDAVAIEVERISEGQRFMTRLLTEGNGAIGQLAGGQRDREVVKREG